MIDARDLQSSRPLVLTCMHSDLKERSLTAPSSVRAHVNGHMHIRDPRFPVSGKRRKIYKKMSFQFIDGRSQKFLLFSSPIIVPPYCDFHSLLGSHDQVAGVPGRPSGCLHGVVRDQDAELRSAAIHAIPLVRSRGRVAATGCIHLNLIRFRQALTGPLVRTED